MKNTQVKNHLSDFNYLAHNSQFTNIIHFSNFSSQKQLLAQFNFISSNETKNINYPTIVNITATKNYASQFGDIGEFVITRNGDPIQDLIVKYSIEGTAKYGVDYQPIANFAIFPAGVNQAIIIIQPQKSDFQGTRTILLKLENFLHNHRYMLGENSQAVVKILDDVSC
jgi:hypothetical protein